MLALLPLALLLAAPGRAAEPLSAKIDREYVQPVLQQLQGALDGREPTWTPPVLPGSAQAAALSEKVRTLWLEPLMGADQGYAFAAARSLASPKTFEPPAEPDLAAILPSAPSQAADDLASSISRNFLSRLFPADYALGAAAALGSGRPDAEGPSAPDLAELAKFPGGSFGARKAKSERFARRDDFARKRKVADSTSLTRGSGASAGAPKLKAFSSALSAAP